MTITLKSRVATAGLLAAVAVTALAGCTGNGGTTATKSPEPNATATAQKPTCTDGFLLLDADALGSKKQTITEACKTTDVVGSKGTFDLTGTGTLVVEGDGNTVTVDESTTIVRLAGSGNSIRYSGAVAPQVDDKGQKNTVSAAK